MDYRHKNRQQLYKMMFKNNYNTSKNQQKAFYSSIKNRKIRKIAGIT